MDGPTYADMVKPVRDVPQMPYGAPGELAASNVGIKADPIKEYLCGVTCHSAAQTKEMLLIATLQGQNVNYLRNRLEYFPRESCLPLPSLNSMRQFAKVMSEDQRADVAAWFASQNALPK